MNQIAQILLGLQPQPPMVAQGRVERPLQHVNPTGPRVTRPDRAEAIAARRRTILEMCRDELCSRAELRAAIGCSESTIKAATDALVAEGWLSSKRLQSGIFVYWIEKENEPT